MNRINILVILFGLIFQMTANAKQKPAVFIIGDSTVKNGQGNGAGGLWGWGRELPAFFIDLNELVAKQYEELGAVKVKSFFSGDHTHTNLAGATLNAETVIQGIRELKNCELKAYLN